MAKAIKKQVLGRGLSALLNDEGTERNHSNKNSAEFVSLNLDQIKVNPYQPRTKFYRICPDGTWAIYKKSWINPANYRSRIRLRSVRISEWWTTLPSVEKHWT